MNCILSSYANSRNDLLKGPYAAIDTEYKVNYENKSKPYTIYAASVVDSDGGIRVKHIMDFQNHSQPEKELVKWLMQEILKYKLTLGWYSKGVRIQNNNGTYEGKDSDLKILDSVCKYYNIHSIIKFDIRGIPFVSGYDIQLSRIHNRYYHIDLYQIYKKPLIKSIIYKNKYKDLSLDTVSKSILGEGKLENLDGLSVQKLSKEKQLEYVAQDAYLVMKLSKSNNFEILDLMNAVSLLTNVPFDRVCHTQISTWWKKIIEDKIKKGESRGPNAQVKKRKYIGGYVIEPIVGFYYKQPVYVLDVKSLYPSMMIAHNISFDTVNCECCKNNPNAKVDDEIMNLINHDLSEEEGREHYWICKNPDYTGILRRLLQHFRDERFKQREMGNELMQIALKNLINGCYGLFGSEFFEFTDYRVAELTTAYGRQTLKYMQHIGKKVYGFTVIYGDTDSIFVTHVKKENDIMKFIAECSILLDIDVEESHIYKKFLITKKKHYIGIYQDDKKEPDIKGMEGIKSDRPLWINKIEKQFANDIKSSKKPTINILREYRTLEKGKVFLSELVIKVTLKKDPSEYPQNSLQRSVGIEIGAKQGDAISYYKSDVSGGDTCNIDLLSRRKYLEMLKTTLEDSLKVMGYDYIRDIVGHKKLHDYTIQPKTKDIMIPHESTSSVRLEEPNRVQNLPWVNTDTSKKAFSLDIRTLIRCQTTNKDDYTYVPCSPATGVLYITDDNPTFISGQIRMRGKDEGRYPYRYLEMIDTIFGPDDNTIEVCSRSVTGINKGGSCFTVDINLNCNPDLAVDGQKLEEIEDNKFNRWRCDPPYNENTAKKMYGTSLPHIGKLLHAGARVCKPGSLMFLLLGKNYQPCPRDVKRIGMITISVIPNNELRVLNIFYKFR